MSLLVVAALLFGVGVNTAIFSVVNAVLLRPLPILEPERVVRIFPKINQTGAPIGGISYPEYLDWKAQVHSFEALTVLRAFSFYLSGNGFPEHLKGSGITASGFNVFGVTPILGRSFSENDDGPEVARVAVLNYAFWQRKFGGDANVVGRSISLDDQSYTIIGVLQPVHIGILEYPDVWVPNGLFVDQRMQNRDSRYYFPAGRLKPQATEAQAQAELETIASRLAAQYPASNKDVGIRIVGLTEQLTASGRKPLSWLFAVSSLIFVLACLNILIVFISSVSERRKELSIRLALGSGRFHILRQLFIQSVIFVGAGSILGLAAAKLVLVFFLRRFPGAVLRFQETTIDYRVIAFMATLACLTTLLAAALPAWYATRLNINSALKGDIMPVSWSGFRTLRQGALIVFEVTLASTLALGSGLLIRSFYEVTKVDLGFSPQQVLSFQINLPTRYKGRDQAAFYKQALDKVSQLPGVSFASGIESLPLTTQGSLITLKVDGLSPLAAQSPRVQYDSILPGFFKTMNLPLLQGHDFTESDRTDTTPVVIVDDVLAAKFWPGESPIGKHLRLLEVADGDAPWRVVVGVAKEIKHFGPEAKMRWMQVYVPEYQAPTPVLSFVLKTPLPEGTVKASAEQAIHELDAGLPLDNFQSMETLLGGFMASRKVSLLLTSAFAGVAMLLAAIGIYGVIANSVVRRRREIAIRMALGATPQRAMVLVARLGMLSALTGILLGAALVISMTRLLASFLFGITALDPGVYLLSAGVVVALALVAIMTPAMRVLTLNPQNILRE
jgi:putative ABC transport system permease protein